MKLLQFYETTVTSDISSHEARFLTVPHRSIDGNQSAQSVDAVLEELGLRKIADVQPSNLGHALAVLLSPSATDNMEGELIRAAMGQQAPHTNAIVAAADITFAELVAYTDVVPFETSPLSAQALVKFVTTASGGALGAYAGFVAFGASPLLLVMVPTGMILCGAAKGVADGLEHGLRERILKLFKVKAPKRAAK